MPVAVRSNATAEDMAEASGSSRASRRRTSGSAAPTTSSQRQSSQVLGQPVHRRRSRTVSISGCRPAPRDGRGRPADGGRGSCRRDDHLDPVTGDRSQVTIESSYGLDSPSSAARSRPTGSRSTRSRTSCGRIDRRQAFAYRHDAASREVVAVDIPLDDVGFRRSPTTRSARWRGWAGRSSARTRSRRTSNGRSGQGRQATEIFLLQTRPERCGARPKARSRTRTCRSWSGCCRRSASR